MALSGKGVDGLGGAKSSKGVARNRIDKQRNCTEARGQALNSKGKALNCMEMNEMEEHMESYELSLSTLEALYLREELNWAANNHRAIAKMNRDVAVPGFSGHIKIAEWHEDKANICEELAYRVSQVLGD